MARSLPLLSESLGASGDPGVLRLGVAANGDLRWAVVDLTGPVEAMRARVDLSPTAAVALGRALSASSLLLRFSTKMAGRLRLEVLGDGPLGRLYAETDSTGMVRGTVEHMQFPGFEPGTLEVGRAVGKGMLKVTHEFAGRRPPHVSQTELVDGEIGNDLVHFLFQSQQIQSAALLSVLPGPTGVVAAGGLLIEAFPQAAEEAVGTLEANLRALGPIGGAISEGGAEGLLDAVLDGLDREELESYPLHYGCSCRRERLFEQMRTLPKSDLIELGNDSDEAIIECSYCLGEVVFSIKDLLN
ncbi:MAG: Hsp33 family molecular chaperone HslO [Acidobacteriota bacterium]